jgi:hypothetical protein
MFCAPEPVSLGAEFDEQAAKERPRRAKTRFSF